MTSKKLALIGAAMLFAGCASAPAERAPATAATSPATAEAADGDAQPTAVATVDDGKRVRCINERVTGQLIPQRVCRTEAQWRQIREQSQQYTRDLQGPQIDPGEPGQ